MMKEYEFTLKFSLYGTNNNPESHVDRLHAYGCDDALIDIGQTSRICTRF